MRRVRVEPVRLALLAGISGQCTWPARCRSDSPPARTGTTRTQAPRAPSPPPPLSSLRRLSRAQTLVAGLAVDGPVMRGAAAAIGQTL